jgi:hypothetical protein
MSLRLIAAAVLCACTASAFATQKAAVTMTTAVISNAGCN